jgi:hypothetical protein
MTGRETGGFNEVYQIYRMNREINENIKVCGRSLLRARTVFVCEDGEEQRCFKLES